MNTQLQVFRALSDETRLRIINLLLHASELCVCDLESLLYQSQPKISRHLAYLRRSNLVIDRKEGQWVHYRINNKAEPFVQQVLKAVQLGSSFSSVLRFDIDELIRKIDLKCCVAPVQIRPFQVN